MVRGCLPGAHRLISSEEHSPPLSRQPLMLQSTLCAGSFDSIACSLSCAWAYAYMGFFQDDAS